MTESIPTTTTHAKSRPHLKLHVLASGSKGNCSVVEDAATGACTVIDCGISWKAVRERCETCGIDTSRITAILITHEHTDHTKGLGVLTRGLARLGVEPSIYTSAAIHGASADLQAIQDDVDLRYFARGDTLELGDVSTYAFRTSHDAAESFGFRFECAGDALGFMTDTGIVTGEANEALQRCRILAIEANHDPGMLARGPYPAFLKARIAGEHGHLSNAQSAELLESLLDDCLEQVVGMHISQNNNDYRMPKDALARTVQRNNHPAHALVGYQSQPLSV